MAGSVKKRAGTDKWRARYPDPLKGGTNQIERLFSSKAEAEAWRRAMDQSRHSGAYIDPGDGNRMFAAVADEYRTTWADLEPRTKAGYDHILKLHLLPTFGGAKVSAITPDAIQRYVNRLSETRAPNTVRRIYGVLRKVMETAVARRYIALNPCDAVRLPKPRIKHGDDMVILTPAEINALADAIDPHYKVALYVAATCGLRAGELWALRRKDVDLLTGTLHVRQALKEVNGADPAHLTDDERGLIFGPPKSAASQRKLSIPARPTRPLLSEHLSQPLPGGNTPDSLIFTTPSGLPIRHGLFYRRVFKPAVAKALPADKHGLRWHDLRHTCASLSLAVSPNLTLVKQRLGHADIATTVNTYGHMVPSVDEALAEGVAALFDAAAAQPNNVVELR
jgi:integrase